MKLTTGLSVVLFLFALVTWLAARETIAIIAPIAIIILFIFGLIVMAAVSLDRFQWFLLRRAEFRRDQSLADSARRQANYEADRHLMRLIFEGRTMSAVARRVENGQLLPGNIGGVPVSTYPRWVADEIEALPAPIDNMLPSKVDLSQLISTGPSLDALAIGVEAVNNNLQPVVSPLAALVHIGVGGSSGWGKTVFLQSLAFQMVLSPEPVEIAFIDVEEQSFTPFSSLGRDVLRYPVAHEEDDILAILNDLRAEWHRRRKLFREYPQVDNIAAYNKAAPVALPPIVLMVDEVNMLTDNKEIIEALTKLGQGTRKYGVYCIVGGQNWNAKDIPTKLRDNFSTRIQMRAMSRSQSNVMIADGAAAEIINHGRAYVVIPGRVMVEVQTPYISKKDIINALTGRNGASPIMPSAKVVGSEPNRDEAKAIEAYKKMRDGPIKFSWRKATEKAYNVGRFGKGPNEKLRTVLDKFGIDYSEFM